MNKEIYHWMIIAMYMAYTYPKWLNFAIEKFIDQPEYIQLIMALLFTGASAGIVYGIYLGIVKLIERCVDNDTKE